MKKFAIGAAVLAVFGAAVALFRKVWGSETLTRKFRFFKNFL